MSDAPAKRERLTLTHDFGDFLVELSIALHKHSMYPAGHPSLGPAAAAVLRRADRLFEEREVIAFGIARRQLIIEGIATDPDQPVLQRLAEALHQHYLGAVSLLRGVTPEELGDALRLLAARVEPGDTPLGLSGAGRLPSWPHLRLHPLAFDRLALADDLLVPPGSAPPDPGSRAADLWIGLARAAVSGDPADTSGEVVATEPSAVAVAIDEHPQAEAYDQVIVGYLLQIARELKDASGAEASALRRRTGRVISALRPETLRRLVDMGGNLAQRRTFVLDATDGLAVDAVLQIVKAAADAGGQTISNGLLRMLSKLAAHAEIGQDHIRPLADSALREQVGRLLADWELSDPNPEAYGRLLQALASSAPAGRRAERRVDAAADPLLLAQMSLELGTTGPLTDRAVVRAAAAGQALPLLQLLASPPAGGDQAAKAILAGLAQPAAVRALLARSPVDLPALEHLLPFLSVDACEVLLDALVDSESRTVRHKLVALLSRPDLAVDLVPLLVPRLADERWYVQRNVLLLLARSPRVPDTFPVASWTTHADPRVRHEAIRLQLRLEGQRRAALAAALQDGDERIVTLGLAALHQDCPAESIDQVARLATDPKVSEELRVMAVRALAASTEPPALDALLRVADGGRTLLGRPKLPPRTPSLLAALKALAGAWHAEARAAAVLALADKSPDADIRAAAGRAGHE